ncbi:hypothetical protein RJ639_027120 [Escallonia herrerae]|uniref:Pollen Ole e 1 allergen and extensin family protein n=1 Tax=Escallonia herrerae TaxID=1293975 RepID=A0AA88X4M0_9ASTE|nr:hypothetical protein RJ639_027120 [Escallonia herrerae]
MMNHFRGCNNLVITMSLIFLFFCFFFLGTPVIAAGRENPLVELSSAEDLTEVAGYGEEKLSTVLVSGTILCEACLDEKARLPPRPVSGAQVAVSCHTGGRKRKSKIVRGSTDEFGDFLIDLPSHLHAIPNLEKLCLLKVLQLPKNSLCRPAFTVKHKRIKLSSVGNGIRTYTAQRIHLTPKPSAPCMTKESNEKTVFLY